MQCSRKDNFQKLRGAYFRVESAIQDVLTYSAKKISLNFIWSDSLCISFSKQLNLARFNERNEFLTYLLVNIVTQGLEN